MEENINPLMPWSNSRIENVVLVVGSRLFRPGRAVRAQHHRCLMCNDEISLAEVARSGVCILLMSEKR